ncbi:unnamed protein product [Parajaminaea phylloscopi]
MDRDADPALQFFPDGEVDLYGALAIKKDASADEIKKAYRKLALRYHPDKVGLTAASSSATSAEDIKQRFQQINFAYTVLSTDTRRKRYDETGRTDESMFEEVNWEEWVKDFGKLDADKLDKFKAEYQNSEEERDDLLEAYRESKGSLEEIFTRVPCSEVLADEQRFVSIIEAAISAGEVEALPAWTKTIGNEKARKQMREKAKKEASEAEEYAKELGVWDELFGKGGKKSGTSGATDEKADARGRPQKRPARKGADEEEAEVEGDASSDEDEEAPAEDDDDEDDEIVKPKARASAAKRKRAGTVTADKAPAKGKGKGATPSSSTSSIDTKQKKGKKAKSSGDDEDGDLAGLEALFAKRQAQRSSGFNDMIARMEARAKADVKASSSSSAKRSKGGKAKSESRDYDEADDGEPDEEAFLAARARLDANKARKDTGKASEKSGGASKKPRERRS